MADIPTKSSNGFLIIRKELCRRTRKPSNQFVYWIYFLLSVCILGGVGVHLETIRYIHGSSESMSGLHTALATFFPALIGSSAVQMIFEPTADRRILAFALITLFFTLISASLLLTIFANMSGISWFLALTSCFFSLWIWWIANADNNAFYDDASSLYAPIGGANPNKKLAGNTAGFKV